MLERGKHYIKIVISLKISLILSFTYITVQQQLKECFKCLNLSFIQNKIRNRLGIDAANKLVFCYNVKC